VCEGAANSTREARETRGKHQQVHASAQCLGYSFEFGEFTHEICFPSKNTIMNQVKRAVERIGAVAVFVASERDAMIEDFQKALKPTVRCHLLTTLCESRCLSRSLSLSENLAFQTILS